MRQPLATVTTSDLSRRPRDVLSRVERGERLLVCHWRKPVATLQPLDGYVLQPFGGTVHDVFGRPFGGIDGEIAKLSPAQRALLTDGYRDWRLRPTLVRDLEFSVLVGALEEMAVEGLATKAWRGWELTGRGLALREALLRREGRDPYGQDQMLPGSRRDSKTCCT